MSYLSHKSFLACTAWGADNENMIKILLDSNGISQVFCILTGIVSKDNLHILPMGDCKLIGQPPQPTVPIVNLHIKFSLAEPIEFPHLVFINDFKQSVKAVMALIDLIPLENKNMDILPFLTHSKEGKWHFNFKYNIFQKKVSFYIFKHIATVICS